MAILLVLVLLLRGDAIAALKVLIALININYVAK